MLVKLACAALVVYIVSTIMKMAFAFKIMEKFGSQAVSLEVETEETVEDVTDKELQKELDKRAGKTESKTQGSKKPQSRRAGANRS